MSRPSLESAGEWGCRTLVGRPHTALSIFLAFSLFNYLLAYLSFVSTARTIMSFADGSSRVSGVQISNQPSHLIADTGPRLYLGKPASPQGID